MKYNTSTIKDFLENEDFLAWVRNPTPALDLFWQNRLRQHPEIIQQLVTARQIVLSMHYRHHAQVSDTELIEVWKNIKQNKYSKSSKQSKIIPLPPSRLHYIAMLLLFSLLIAKLWLENYTSVTSNTPVKESNRIFQADYPLGTTTLNSILDISNFTFTFTNLIHKHLTQNTMKHSST